MTIAEAKQVRIVDFLARLGHHTAHKIGTILVSLTVTERAYPVVQSE